jgi:hypothetical protein
MLGSTFLQKMMKTFANTGVINKLGGRQLTKIFLREQLSMRSKKDNYNFTIFFLCYYSIVSWIKRFLKPVLLVK